ncbi:hypothetical protein HAX54_029172 [Datura stramonium]|uniref:Uncharacterized protein n=1 Tax=Datura stramonium TaxID=4076 RepID=A0ABS8SA34_DATST|nr:hypothetical protein [Datura stramonium]
MDLDLIVAKKKKVWQNRMDENKCDRSWHHTGITVLWPARCIGMVGAPRGVMPGPGRYEQHDAHQYADGFGSVDLSLHCITHRASVASHLASWCAVCPARRAGLC